MQLVDGNFKFAFNYAAFTQASNLFVAGSVYDVTSGTPSFIGQVPMSHTINGAYYGTFQGTPGKTYLVITVVFTNSSYNVINPLYAPGAECYQAVQEGLYFFAYNYATYDQNDGLFLAGNVYDVTSGSTFVEQQAMTLVDYGTYFGSFTPTVNHSYVVEKSVYTNGSYTTTDPNRAPGLDSFQSFDISGSGIVITNLMKAAILVGQSTESVLEAQC